MQERRAYQYPWRTQVYCQRFFTHSSRQEYFEVAKPSPDVAGSHPPPVEIGERGRRELARIQEKQAQIAERDARAQPQQISDTNPWLERVEWAQHLAVYPFEEMIQWAELPRDDEIILQRIYDGFTRMIDIAQQLILSQRCMFFARVEINRKKKEKTP